MKQKEISLSKLLGKKRMLSLFTGFLALSGLQGYSQACTNCLPHTDPNNTGNWIIQEDFSDEFNNGRNLDETKWHRQGKNNKYYNNWKGRQPSQFIPESISQNNGILTIKSDWDPSFEFAKDDPKIIPPYGSKPITTGALISNKLIKYGYLEVKSRLGKSPMSGSFWGVDESNVGELDVFENVGQAWDTAQDNADYPTIMQSSFHTWDLRRPMSGESNRVWTNTSKLEFDVTEAFHVYAADWTSEYVRLYVDGKLVKEITKAHAESIEFDTINAWCVNSEMRIWLDCEIFPWVGDINKLRADMFGPEGKFEVDYVRIWKRGNGGSNAKTGEGRNLVTNSDFATNTNGWNITGPSSRVNYKAPAGVDPWVFWKSDNDNTDNFCLQIGGGDARAEQTITGLEPNTSYILTSQLRCPNTTGSVEPISLRNASTIIWQNAYFGVKDHGAAKIERKIFLNWFQSYGIQFTTGANATSATIYYTNAGNEGAFHIDNVKVVKLDDLRSGAGTVVTPNPPTTTPPTTPNPAPPVDVPGAGNGKEFFIVNRATTHRLRPKTAEDDADIIQVANTDGSNWTRWSKVPTDDGFYFLKNKQTGKYFRPISEDDATNLQQKPSSFTGTFTQWKDVPATGNFVFLRNRATAKHIRPVNEYANVKIELRPNTWVTEYTQWTLQPIGGAKAIASTGSKINISANTASKEVTVNLNDVTSDDAGIKIYDLSGKVVYSNSIVNNQSVFETQLQSGVYIVIVNNQVSRVTKKLLIK